MLQICCIWGKDSSLTCCKFVLNAQPFPTYSKPATDDFENMFVNTQKISINESTKLKKVENILANGEIAHLEPFLLLPTCFQKSSAAEASESVYMWERVKVILLLYHSYVQQPEGHDCPGSLT